MKRLFMIAGLLAASTLTSYAGERVAWNFGDQIRICFPGGKVPEVRPEGCILTPHPLGEDTHGGAGRRDPLQLKWSKADAPGVEHHKNDSHEGDE